MTINQDNSNVHSLSFHREKKVLEDKACAYKRHFALLGLSELLAESQDLVSSLEGHFDQEEMVVRAKCLLEELESRLETPGTNATKIFQKLKGGLQKKIQRFETLH